MPSWVSSLLTQGVGLAVLVALFVLSVVESHVRDVVWGRLVGSVVAAATQRSRKEEQQAIAAAERAARIRDAMATIRSNLLSLATRSGVSFDKATILIADIHRGVAELRTEEPSAKAELDAITTVASRDADLSPDKAQTLLATLEAKLRDLGH